MHANVVYPSAKALPGADAWQVRVPRERDACLRGHSRGGRALGAPRLRTSWETAFCGRVGYQSVVSAGGYSVQRAGIDSQVRGVKVCPFVGPSRASWHRWSSTNKKADKVIIIEFLLASRLHHLVHIPDRGPSRLMVHSLKAIEQLEAPQPVD